MSRQIEHAGLWQDQNVKRANKRAGWKLCAHCNGTGNELYAMYRACQECGGSGQMGEPPLRVRLSRWWRRKRSEVGRTEWRALGRWYLSYYLGVGQWFRDHKGKDSCHRCGTLPSDIDFEMRRVAPRRAECLDSKACREYQAEAGGSDG